MKVIKILMKYRHTKKKVEEKNTKFEQISPYPMKAVTLEFVKYISLAVTQSSRIIAKRIGKISRTTFFTFEYM